jgi:hypothetical protein
MPFDVGNVLAASSSVEKEQVEPSTTNNDK